MLHQWPGSKKSNPVDEICRWHVARKNRKEHKGGPENCRDVFELLSNSSLQRSTSLCRPRSSSLPSNPGVSPSRAPLALYHPTNPSALWDWGQANGRHRLQEEPAIHWAGLGSSSTARWQADQNNPSKVTSFLLLFNCNDSVCDTDPIAGGSAPLRKQYSTVWDCDQKLG